MPPLDYKLHDLARIRLIDASASDARQVAGQLGLKPTSSMGQADLTVRFVDHLPSSTAMRLLGVDEVGYTEHEFFILRGKQKSSVRVQIPFDQIGQPCELVCQRGLSAIPLLIPILNLTVLGKGVIPLHASAFEYQGTGVLVTGWAKGGKTETLLAYLNRGATYVGDEWIYLAEDGRQMFGIPEPMRLWDWHLQHLPGYRRTIERRQRARLSVLKATVRTLQRPNGNGASYSGRAQRMRRQLAFLLQNQMHVRVSPSQLVGADRMRTTGLVERILFVSSHQSPEIVVQPMDAKQVARRMVFSLQEERRELWSYYRKYRFAFPDRPNALIEHAERQELELLETALVGKPCLAVQHPYPVRIPDLFDATQRYL